MASKIIVDQLESSGSNITIPTGTGLVVTDGIAATNLSGTIADARLPTVPVAKGGTGLTSLGSAGQAVKVNSAGNALEFGSVSGGGKVLQAQYGALLGGWAAGGTGDQDVTGYNVTITPSATSSKILVQAHFCGSLGDYGGGFKLFRGSTWISQPTSASSRNLVHTGGYIGQNYTVQQYSISILDEPSTTSATTYKIVAQARSNTQYKVNESQDDANNADRPRTIATIVAMEIGA